MDQGGALAGLQPGAYEVRETNPAALRYSTTPDSLPVLVSAGETVTADFGDWSGWRWFLPLVLEPLATVDPDGVVSPGAIGGGCHVPRDHGPS